VSKGYIQEKERRGELYLFEIYNKDFSEYANGAKNVHTLYFLNLFSDLNLQNPLLRLAGNAEIFCRLPSVKKQVVQRKFIRPIIAYKRFTEQKYFFHIPISINANVNSIKEKKLNTLLNQRLISKDSSANVIGIDRGEKHLAFYSVINRDSKIIASGSFNEINGVKYFEMLRMREKERLEQRRSWKAISQIKDLKRGYISQVVHQLAELVIEHNAIVVFEDLNLRFKEIRGGVERSVYQQLEKAVIEKFGYMVFKKREALAPGGVLHGYQLATPVQSFEEMSRQNGIIFYVNPEYTSITDPVTGWRQHIYLSSSANDGTLLEAFTKKIQIGYDESKRSYIFSYNQKDFAPDKDAVSHEWVLYADMPRIDR
jgi:CRISPR-associated protein Cpf1